MDIAIFRIIKCTLLLQFLLVLVMPSSLTAAETEVAQHINVTGASGEVQTQSDNPQTGVHSISLTMGQPLTGEANSANYSADLGIWSLFLKEPDAPLVSATDGDRTHPDFIRISYILDKLSPPADFSTPITEPPGTNASDKWVVTKDGNWRANVPKEDPAFDDDQSIFPGDLYNYGVRVSNEYGFSPEGTDIGFTIPNGKISGRVFTPGPTPGAPWTPPGNPVADVEVSLSPIRGKAVQLDGVNDYISVNADYADSTTTAFTLEFWYYIDPAAGNATIFDWGDRLRVYQTSSYLRADIAGFIVQDALPAEETWNHAAIVYDGDQLKLYQNGSPKDSIGYTNVLPAASDLRFGKRGNDTEYFDGNLDDIRLWRIARTADDIVRNKDRALFGSEPGLLGYWKFDENQDVYSFDMTEPRENAELANGATWSDNFAEIQLSAYTDETGEYEIQGVWYDASSDNGTDYTVTPAKPDHPSFSPASDVVTLTRTEPNASDVKFLDESLFTLSGVIMYEGTTCPVEGAEILLDSASTRPQTFTSGTGAWSLDLEPGKSGQLSVRFGGHFEYDTTVVGEQTIIDTNYVDGHTFLLNGSEQGYTFTDIGTDIAGINFTNEHTETLKLVVGGGECLYSIGPVSVTVETSPSCDTLEMSASTGSDTIVINNLPPLDYVVSITSEHPDIEFQDKPVSLRDTSQSMTFVYKAPLSVEFVDVPWQSGCPVVEQFKQDSVLASVYEEYGGYTVNDVQVPVNRCPLDEFAIQAFDDWSGINTDLVGVDAPDGEIWYQFEPKEPNLLAGGDHPYQKQLTILVRDPLGREATKTQWAYVTGRAVTEGTDFVSRPARTNRLPFFVLRDPPGDGSYSYLEESQTVSRTFSMSHTDENDETNEIQESFGLDSEVSVGFSTPFGGPVVQFTNEVEVTADFNQSWGITETATSLSETQISFTTSELYQTNEDELIVGDGADIFVGAGLNVTYSRMVDLSLESCTVQLDTSFGLSDITGFHSFYVYSDYHIRNNLIPDLEDIYANSPPEDTAAIGESIRYWDDLLAKNEAAKDNAVFTDAVSNTGESLTNISWDALSSYEYSTQTDSTFAESYEITVEEYSSSGSAGGVEINGIGVVGGQTTSDVSIDTDSDGTEETYSTTMGFHFTDNDPGDAFSVNIKRDTVWNMPVFELVGGQSSRPWEEGTFKRQWADLTIDPPVQVDIDPNEAAIFDLGLGNQSETGETWVYNLNVLNETNPDGAVLKVNGQNLARGVDFELGPGETTNATLTVEKGSEAYHYEDITLELAPPGEQDIADALGTDPLNSDWADVSAHFIAPCTPVELSQANGNDTWSVNRADSNRVNFIFSGYDSTDVELEYLVIEYSLVDENDWIEADSTVFARDTVVAAGQDFLVATWNVTNLDDGEYKIRAKSQCRLRQSYSQELTGTIDRVRPEMLGVAEPVDGVLNMNDQVEITFTEPINCQALNANSAELFYAQSGQEIASEITCNGNSIIISPATSVDNREIENQRLRAEVHFLQDQVGNGMLVDTLAWEFTVNRNPVAWNQNSIEMIAFTDTTNGFSMTLNNIGATPQPFDLTELAPWLIATPNQGEINPGGSFEIQFTVDPDLDVGEYTDTLFAESPEGVEPFAVNVVSMCPYPDWQISPFDYEFSMTVTGNVLVQGMQSTDEYDRIGAFVNGEPRGFGHVEYVPALEDYRAYLTVYSNTFSGDTVTFHLWDRTGCEEFWEMDTSVVFSNDATIGTPESPLRLNATGVVAQSLDFPSGFKWFSLNIESDSGDLNSSLEDLTPEEGDRIVSQSAYAQFQASTNTWVGPLSETGLYPGAMYFADLTNENTIDYVGHRVVPDTMAIPLSADWNWLGYLPDRNMNVNIALGTLSPSDGDIVKDQVSFAQYVSDLGWIGNLNRMFSGNGYKIRLEHADTLTYPNPESGSTGRLGTPGLAKFPDLAPEFPEDSLPEVHWTVDNPYEYQNTMTMTAVIYNETQMLDDPYDMIAVLIDDEVRGTARPMMIPGIDEPRLFLSIHGRPSEDDPIEFRIWDNDKERTYRTVETFSFAPEDHQGTVSDPLTMTQTRLAFDDPDYIPEQYMLSQNYPNPFNPTTVIGYGLPEATHVTLLIYNIRGQVVKTISRNALQQAGYYRITWDGTNRYGQALASGMYIVRLRTPAFTKIRKMVLIR